MQQIIYNDDTVAIFADLMPLIRQLYVFYFDMERNAEKGLKKISPADLKKASLKSCMNFLKDFNLCPYILHPRICLFVWHSIQDTIGKRDSILSLTNNYDQALIVP